MAKKTIIFKLENVEESMILSTAVRLGYQEKINETTEVEKTIDITRAKYEAGDYSLPEGAAVSEEYISGDKKEDDIVVTYTVQETNEIDNPVSAEEYMNVVFAERFVGDIIKPAAIAAMTAMQEEEIATRMAELDTAKQQISEQLTADIDVSASVE